MENARRMDRRDGRGMTAAALKFESEDRQGVRVIHVSGPLDSANYEQFRQYMDPVVDQPNARTVLACRNLSDVNSRGVALLVHYHRSATVVLSYFAIAELSPHIRKNIEMLGLGHLLTWHATLEDALAEAGRL